jgi:hypothetical protein
MAEAGWVKEKMEWEHKRRGNETHITTHQTTTTSNRKSRAVSYHSMLLQFQKLCHYQVVKII